MGVEPIGHYLVGNLQLPVESADTQDRPGELLWRLLA
jgi:hypothetical protein